MQALAQWEKPAYHRQMIRIGNAPCSWGVIENVQGSRTTWETVLDEIAATGYAGTELGDWGFMPTDPAVLRRELNQRDLQLVGAWVSVHLHDQDKRPRDIADARRTARLVADVGGDDAIIILGNDPHTDFVRTKFAGRVTSEMSLSAEQWNVFGTGANAIAAQLRDEFGLRTVLHPHVATYVETPEEIAAFLNETDPELVGIAFDTAHIAYGGGNPAETLERIIDRVWHVHFKGYSDAAAVECRTNGIDAVDAVGKGVFCDLAGSDLDFAAFFKTLHQHQYNGWIVVEQDVLPGTGTPKENAQRNREFIRALQSRGGES
jgi:inosose dehydratase